MPKLRLAGRKAALMGVSAAAATAAVVAVAAPAAAAPSQTRLTTCSDTVRVHSQPSQTAPVIGSCRTGEKVTVDDTRNGFAHLVDKQGWASLDFLNLRSDLRSSDSNFGDNCDSADSKRDDDGFGDDQKSKSDRCKDDRYNSKYDRGGRYDNGGGGLLSGLTGN